MRLSAGVIALSIAGMGFGGCAGTTAQSEETVTDLPGPPWKAVPTFPTENIGRQGHFYVGGKWEGEPGQERMRGAMYGETWVPKEIRYPYPILFVGEGGGQTSVAMLMTPDGRPGWAYDFVNRGYTVYMMDFPGRGRSAFIPGVDGNIVPPRATIDGGSLDRRSPTVDGKDCARARWAWRALATEEEVQRMAK